MRFGTLKKHLHTASKNTFSAVFLLCLMQLGKAFAGECEISGLNLMAAYQKAINNGGTFECRYRGGVTARWLADSIFVPTPSGLLCQHSTRSSKSRQAAELVARGVNQTTGRPEHNFTYSLLFFKNSLKRDWKISRYTATGGGKKINTRGKHIEFETVKDPFRDWTVGIKKLWIKKDRASCRKMDAVLRNAFEE